MYYYLDGKLALIKPNIAVIDCMGVGYKCFITKTTYDAIFSEKQVKLYTYLNVKEDALDIYGFATEREKEFFEILISVSGVGPKAALSVLSEMTPEEFASAVLSSNAKRITAAQGVGPKMAQRICLELKDKISGMGVENIQSESTVSYSPAVFGAREEAVSVLIALGYNKTDAESAVLKCSDESTEDIVRQALRFLSRLV